MADNLTPQPAQPELNPNPAPAPAPSAPNGGTQPPVPPGEKAYTLAEVRQLFAGGDEKRARQMERFTDLSSIGSSYFEQQNAISSRGLRTPPPGPDARPEEVAAYRAQRGVPDKPEGYLTKLPQGLVIGEIDRDVINDFVGVAHEQAVEPAIVHRFISWYYDNEAKAAKAQTEAETEAARKTEADLVGVLGPVEYRRSNEHLTNWLAKHGKAGEMLKSARGPDGIPILDTAIGRKWLMDLARTVDPITLVMPGVDGGDMTSLQDELDKIDKYRREHRTEYNRDEKMQARERSLIDAKLAVESRRR